MKHLLIILSILLLSFPLFGQRDKSKSPKEIGSERPETIIIPVSGIGDVTNTRKLILGNTLTDELKKHFRIVPQEKYEQVLEQVFEELEYEECSEDTCIMRVQEMLQVENVFNLQIIGEGNDTQLNLKWITLDERKNETDVCLSCGTFQLNEKVRGLVEKLVGVKTVEPVVVVKKRQKGVLFGRKENGELRWYITGNEDKDGKYVGEIENVKPNGHGTFTFPDGFKYVGEFKDGKPNGQGTETYPDGRKYVGEWKDGEINGQGKVTYSNGEKYIGEWKDRKFDGHGTYTFPDGEKYVGEWKDGKKNGQGTDTFADGKKYVGEYKDDMPWNGTGYYKNGKIAVRYVNGEIK